MIHEYLKCIPLNLLRISLIRLEWRAATPAGKVCPSVTPQRAEFEQRLRTPPRVATPS